MAPRILLFVGFALVGFVAPALSQDVDTLRRDNEALRKELSKLQDELIDHLRNFDITKRQLTERLEAALSERTRFEREAKLAAARLEALQRETNPEEQGKDDATRIREKLDAKLEIDFADMPISECLEFCRQVTGLNIVVAEGIDLSNHVSLRLKGVSCRNVLSLLLASGSQELTWSERGQVIEIHAKSAAAPKAPDASRAKVWKALRARQITLNMEDSTSLSDILDFLRDYVGVNIVVTPDVDLSKTLRVMGRDLTVPTALSLILELADPSLVWLVRDHGVTITRAAGRTTTEAHRERHKRAKNLLATHAINLDFDNRPLAEAIQFLRDITGLTYVIKGDVSDLTSSVQVEQLPLGEAIGVLMASTHKDLEWRLGSDGIIRIQR